MSDEGAIRCVIYAAKSTEDRRGSIPEQLRECREAIEADPRRRLVSEYVDEAFSAYRRDRGPGLRDATQHAEDLAGEHGVAELWAQHSDRLARGDGRKARHTVEIALWALKHDVRVRTLQDPETFRDLLYAVVTGQRNNEDSKRKAIATQAGRKRAIARGEYVGHLPDGYRLITSLDADDQIQKRLEFDPDRRPLFELIFRLALRGRSCGQIARAVNDRGWLTKPVRRIDRPRRFEVGKIYDLLKNPRYAGLAVYRGEILARGHWPTYITERQHQQIIRRLAAPRAIKRHEALEPYLLAQLARCGRCGSTLRVHSGRQGPDGAYVRRYVCAGHVDYRGRNQCPAPPIHAHTIEAMLIANLHSLLAPTDPDRQATPGRGGGDDPNAWIRAAAAAGNELDLEHAIAALFARLQPYAALARDGIVSQRRARELSDAERLRVWVEQEGNGRTHASREQVPEFNRLLRVWFTEVTVRVDPGSVKITATPRRGAGPPAVPTEVQIVRAVWTRAATPAHRGWTLHGTWEPPEIIGALQAWADAHGRSPRRVEWKFAAPEHPQALTVTRHLGSWNEALRQAGLETVTPPQRYAWREDEIVKALHAWTRKHGQPPFAMEWAKARPQHPSAATVRAHYGHWDDALHAAGLPPVIRAKHRLTPWPQPEIIRALQRWAAARGRPPHGLDWITAAPDRPCAGTVYNHYGTWSAALSAAGLPSGASRGSPH